MTPAQPPADFEVVVVAIFRSQGGQFPPPAQMAQQIVDAFLAKDPRLWNFVYPVPTPAPVQHWRVKSAIVNLREGPGTTYKVLGQVRQGDTLTQTGEMQAGWLPTTQGWVSGSLVEVETT